MDEVPAFPGNLSPQKTKQRQFHRRKNKRRQGKKKVQFHPISTMSWVDIVNQGHPLQKKVSRNKTQLKGTKTTPKPAKF